MTFGDVGCFMSHYFIWLKGTDHCTIVLEDDIDFQLNFKSNVQQMLREVNNYDPECMGPGVSYEVVSFFFSLFVVCTHTHINYM